MLGQNLKLRTAIQGFLTTQYLAGGSAGRIRNWPVATFTIAALIRLTNRATAQVIFDSKNAGSNAGFSLQMTAGGSVRGVVYGSAATALDVATTAADVDKDMLIVLTNYSSTSRQVTVNGRRVTTDATANTVVASPPAGPVIGVSVAVATPFLGGLYDLAICYNAAIPAANQQDFYEQVVAEAGIPGSCQGTAWDHLVRAEGFSGRLDVSQAQLGDVASGVNFKLTGTAVGSPSTLVRSPLRPLTFGLIG